MFCVVGVFFFSLISVFESSDVFVFQDYVIVVFSFDSTMVNFQGFKLINILAVINYKVWRFHN